jgi:hypothetical protein
VANDYAASDRNFAAGVMGESERRATQQFLDYLKEVRGRLILLKAFIPHDPTLQAIETAIHDRLTSNGG